MVEGWGSTFSKIFEGKYDRVSEVLESQGFENPSTNLPFSFPIDVQLQQPPSHRQVSLREHLTWQTEAKVPNWQAIQKQCANDRETPHTQTPEKLPTTYPKGFQLFSRVFLSSVAPNYLCNLTAGCLVTLIPEIVVCQA